MEVSGQLHASAALPTVPIHWKARWVSETVWLFWSRQKSLAHRFNKPNSNVGVAASMLLFVERDY